MISTTRTKHAQARRLTCTCCMNAAARSARRARSIWLVLESSSVTWLATRTEEMTFCQSRRMIWMRAYELEAHALQERWARAIWILANTPPASLPALCFAAACSVRTGRSCSARRPLVVAAARQHLAQHLHAFALVAAVVAAAPPARRPFSGVEQENDNEVFVLQCSLSSGRASAENTTLQKRWQKRFLRLTFTHACVRMCVCVGCSQSAAQLTHARLCMQNRWWNREREQN